MFGQTPVQSVVLSEGFLCEFPRVFFMRRFGLRPRGALEGCDHPVAHLGGCLPRESDCNDGLRLIDSAQQCQESLNEEFSLPGTGRCLHDE